MEQQKSLMKVQPGYLKTAMDSIEGMMQLAETLLASGLCPSHFYEKGADNKPDLTKGKPAAVVIVLAHGQEVGLSAMQSLQQVVPVNGLISIKGDGAKSLIFESGVLEPGSWKEEVTGTIEGGDYKFSVTAKRRDNGLILTRSFSVDDAKRAGLWIEQSKLQGADGWKYKLSSWYKYPERMIRYRALGFLARDLFPDVLAGMYTSEEAADLPQDETQVITTPGGQQVIVPDKEHSKERSQNLTNKASDYIDKKQEFKENFRNAESLTATEDTSNNQNNEEQRETEVWETLTEEAMMEMDSGDLLEICEASKELKRAVIVIPGKNTNKKLRNIILERQKGMESFTEYVLSFKSGEEQEPDSNQDNQPEQSEEMEGNDTEEREEPANDLNPNEGFEGQEQEESEEEEAEETGNKYGIKIPALGMDGNRSFDDVNFLYQAFNGIQPPVTNSRFLELQSKIEKGKVTQNYDSKEDFCRRGLESDINNLLNFN